jgi:LuxR family maltose regulon positive regulatory protein
VAAWRSKLASLVVNSAESGSDNTPVDACDEIAALTLARVALADGRAEEALTWLEPVTWSARAAGHIGAAISCLVLTAIARQASPAVQGKPAKRAPGGGQVVSSLASLEEALDLAEAGGYVRVLLDEGPPMQLLLARWLACAGSNPLRDYAIHLLCQFDAEPHVVMAVQKKASSASNSSASSGQALVEPLSQRELEVLHLMALGRTNQQIAQQLIVASGTIKAHTASIYRKLDVTNRMEAVARARQLSILP